MTNSLMLGGVYLVMAIMLMLGSLMARREPFARKLTMVLAGHFWVDGLVNGRKVKFLIDSGATMTTIGRETAAEVGVRASPTRNQIVRTGNGFIRVATGTAQELEVGDIERRDLALHIADDEDLNVLGMNFLSSLQRWGVEGRWLILVP
jgi:aspartyl protease family protein